VYLQCADKVVAVDSNEHQSEKNTFKAYLAAHPELRKLPLGGETSGRDNPELLLALKDPPQLIIKADTKAGYDPKLLTDRTGIPVLLIPMRGLAAGKEEFYEGLRLMGTALNKKERAEELIQFFDEEMADIRKRSKKGKTEAEKEITVYAGGVSYNGSHGLNASEAGYPPFEIADVSTPLSANRNELTLGKRHTILAKEILLEWNPDVVFLDLGTLALGSASGLNELRTDPVYQKLDAVKSGKVFALLPNTFYFVNHDAVLANAWFVGKTVYPKQFEDIDLKKKADEIFTFLVGKPVFDLLNAELQGLALSPLPLK
jgi:iron complex transport system substrate-binding protein